MPFPFGFVVCGAGAAPTAAALRNLVMLLVRVGEDETAGDGAAGNRRDPVTGTGDRRSATGDRRGVAHLSG
jgi:hypothetical protein